MARFNDIRSQLGGENAPPWYVVHRGQHILALCLQKDKNPKIDFDSVEVWVGTEPGVADWGEKFAHDKATIPVYVADHEGDDYSCQGLYNVISRQPTQQELAAARAQTVHDLSRIVFLQRATLTEFVYKWR